jgi:hypothetical protein
MRTELEKSKDQRKRFRATYSKLGKKTGYNGYSEETILLTAVTDIETGVVVTDHVWFSFTKGFQEVRLVVDDCVEFEARVKEYTKGYVNKRAGINQGKRDFKLSHPTKIKRITT